MGTEPHCKTPQTSSVLSLLFVVLGGLAGMYPPNVDATNTVVANSRGLVHKGSSSTVVAFPDVCKTPTPGGPVALPYPNMVTDNDYGTGTKQTKTGSNIVINRKTVNTSSGTRSVYEVSLPGTLTFRGGRPAAPTQSTLIEMKDGSFCAICVSKGRITRVLKLLPASQQQQAPRSVPLTGTQTPLKR